MAKKSNILAIIPARGGSKRLPYKNLALLNGISLVAHAIKQAQTSQYITDIIVSSDDDEILQIASQWGARPLKRPARLSGDETPMHLVLEHVIDTLEKYSGGTYRAGIIVLLQPTSPLRTSEDIDVALKLYWSGNCDSVTSVCQGKENGAVYVTHASIIRQGSIYGKQLKQYEMPSERSIDIDTQEDLNKAEIILKVQRDDNSRMLKHKAGRPRKHRNS